MGEEGPRPGLRPSPHAAFRRAVSPGVSAPPWGRVRGRAVMTFCAGLNRLVSLLDIRIASRPHKCRGGYLGASGALCVSVPTVGGAQGRKRRFGAQGNRVCWGGGHV